MSTEIGQQGIRFLFCNNLLYGFDIKRLNIGCIGHTGVGHDGCGVGIDQHDFVTQFSKGLAGLCAGIIKFTGLAYNNRA